MTLAKIIKGLFFFSFLASAQAGDIAKGLRKPFKNVLPVIW